MKRLASGAILILGLSLIGLIATTNPTPQSRSEIQVYAQQLFEFGAIRYVHGLESPHSAKQQALFDKVKLGEQLNHVDSCIYRRAYFLVLHDYARRFQLADDDLQMADNFRMDQVNNCDGHGVAGYHDLHDLSAKANMQELIENIESLQRGAGWLRSIVLINEGVMPESW